MDYASVLFTRLHLSFLGDEECRFPAMAVAEENDHYSNLI